MALNSFNISVGQNIWAIQATWISGYVYIPVNTKIYFVTLNVEILKIINLDNE